MGSRAEGVPFGLAATREAIATVPTDRLLEAQAALSADLIADPDPCRRGPELAVSLTPWQPVVDGEVIPARPIDLIVAGAGGGAAHSPDSDLHPCMMPFITSQFLRREKGDRPDGAPEGWRNLGFTGQFVELPDDVVFTVEYSIRATQAAVSRLLGLDREPPAVYKGQFNPAVLVKAFSALHDMHM